MTPDQKMEFEIRINSVCEKDKPKFGQMNVNQMICHCADQLRVAFGEMKGIHKEDVDLKKLRILIAKGETVPTVDGLNQVAGQGTKPTNLADDKAVLIKYIEKFIECGDDFPFHFHPFLGEMDKKKWDNLVISHLDHHLKQFNR